MSIPHVIIIIMYSIKLSLHRQQYLYNKKNLEQKSLHKQIFGNILCWTSKHTYVCVPEEADKKPLVRFVFILYFLLCDVCCVCICGAHNQPQYCLGTFEFHQQHSQKGYTYTF